MLQKMLKFANYAVAVLVWKIMLFCSNYAKNYASTIRQGLVECDGEQKCILWQTTGGVHDLLPLTIMFGIECFDNHLHK